MKEDHWLQRVGRVVGALLGGLMGYVVGLEQGGTLGAVVGVVIGIAVGAGVGPYLALLVAAIAALALAPLVLIGLVTYVAGLAVQDLFQRRAQTGIPFSQVQLATPIWARSGWCLGQTALM